MSSSKSTAPTSTSPPAQSTSVSVEPTKDDNGLGVLEEDDEFDEFPVSAWDDTHTDLAHLGGTAPGAAKSGGDKLWEDNWDDDDIEDDFSIQLRNELAKKKGNGNLEPMQY